jgi:hypothetical protein
VGSLLWSNLDVKRFLLIFGDPIFDSSVDCDSRTSPAAEQQSH